MTRYAFQTGCRQAFDQVKTAIKNGNLPNDKHIQWVIAVGPYFIIKECGPFTRADLVTCGHRSNPSGDAAVTAFLAELHANPTSRPIGTTIHRIGTQEAAQVLHAYLTA
jgi:hypothetical protein